MRCKSKFVNGPVFRMGPIDSPLLVVLTLTLCGLFPAKARADFAGVGDITGDNIPFQIAPDFILINPAGSPNPVADSTGDMIIGDTAIGGMIADSALPLVGSLFALRSDTAIIGNASGSIGAVNIDDFFFDFGDPTRNGLWRIAGDLVVGHAGQGFLDFLNAGSTGVGGSAGIGGTTYIGGGFGGGVSASPPGLSLDSPSLGQGIVRINGLGSNLTTELLFVGDAGVGFVEASGRSSLNTHLAASIGVGGILVTTGDGTVSLTDLGTRWTASEPVTVGGLAGRSHGKVEIANQAVFQLEEPTIATSSTSSLFINRQGTVDLTGGTLRDLSGTDVSNSGLVRGNGFIDASMTINPTGELRNFGEAGTYPPEEALLVSGAVTNDGLIESLGGEMEFESLVLNNASGDILGRDAIMRFNGGLLNNGDIGFGGATTIYGNIVGSGNFLVLADSTTVIVGSLSLATSSVITLTVGDALGTLDVLGTADLGGSLLQLDYSSGAAAQAGDSYDVLSASGGFGGSMFSNATAVAGGRIWDIAVGLSNVIVTAQGLVGAPIGADFNGDGIVDIQDLLIWEANFGASPATGADGDANGDGIVNGADFLIYQLQLGMAGMPVPLTGSVAVPEPGSLWLALSAAAIWWRRRR